MGLIKIILAISIIITHSSSIFGLSLIRSEVAVELFFMLSGFYMALVLTDKYDTKSDYKLFITNRLLKIFPIYWLILFLSIFFNLVISYLNQNSSYIFILFSKIYDLNIFTFITLIFSNLLIFGQDVLLFFGINTSTGSLFFTSNFRLFKPAIYHYIFIPQAWYLCFEIFFYFLAPFINRLKNKFIIIIMFISLLVRLILYSKGFSNDPWSYRFFPLELIFFLSGILMYRLYLFIKQKHYNLLSILIFIFYISILISYQFLPHEELKQIILFIISFISIPFIFNLLKNNKIDRYVGELSFPIYLSHYLIICVISYFTNLTADYLGLATTIFSIIFSMFILKFFINPINNLRQSRILTNKSNL